MPILTRQPGAMDPEVMHLSSGQRPGGSSIGSASRSSRDLLPVGGSLVPAPVPAPARALALDALRLLRRMRDPSRRPDRWTESTFRRELELVRTHLAPLRTRRTLAASYGREAFHVTLDDAARDEPNAVRLAYALRWLELGAADVGQIWPALEGRDPA